MLEEIHDALHNPKTGLVRRVMWLNEEISVNGSRGLENVLRNNYESNLRNAASIAELKELTHSLKVNRNLRKALNAWIKTHPTLARVADTGFKKLAWFILATIAGYLGYAEWFQ